MLLETVERLCKVTCDLTHIINKQATMIEQSNIEESVKKEMREMRESAIAEFDSIKRKEIAT